MEQIDRALDVNLRAPIVLAHALAPAMVRRGRGHLLFMSSLSGKAATAGTLALQRDQVRPARLRARPCARTCTPAASASPRCSPASSATRACSPRRGSSSRRASAPRSPEDVARAVVSAIERNRAEVDVAPLSVRVGATFAGIAPELAAKVARRLGSENIAQEMEASQRSKS